MSCDFCGTKLEKSIYTVPDSDYNMDVYMCDVCGLVQSFKRATSMHAKKKSTSSGAQFGNLRVGKGIRIGSQIEVLKKHAVISPKSRILDIGSNRGDFVMWAHHHYPKAEITAVEPDSSVVTDYKKIKKISLFINRYEETIARSRYFDFIFCSHTLEHADSARVMLSRIEREIKMGGFLFLEVPNIAIIGESDIVEEFFIDKHTFHFYPEVIMGMLTYFGFEVVCEKTDTSNITLILKKTKPAQSSPILQNKEVVQAQRKLIKRYKTDLVLNRKKLLHISRTLYDFCSRQRVVMWGAGRLLDALITYGGYKVDRLAGIVDTHLSKRGLKYNNTQVLPPSALRILDPQVVIILAKSSALEIERVCRNYGVRHVIKFADLMTGSM